MKRLLGLVVVVGAALVTGGLQARPAGALSNGNFIFAPASPLNVVQPRTRFEYQLSPGQRFEDSVVLSNLLDQAQQFDLWPADGYNTANGGVALRPRGWPERDIGAWIHLPVSSYVVPARSATTFTFTGTVPANAGPGQYVGGIVALDVSQQTPLGSGHNTQVSERGGIAVEVLVRVTGPLRPAASVTSLEVSSSDPVLGFMTGAGRAEVRFHIRNTGNTVLTGAVKANVTDELGRTVKKFPTVRVADLLPGNQIAIDEPVWKPLPIVGREQVHVTFQGKGFKTVGATRTLWVLPWLLLLVVLVCVVAVVAVPWLLYRRRRGTDREPAGGLGRDDVVDGEDRSRSGAPVPRVLSGVVVGMAIASAVFSRRRRPGSRRPARTTHGRAAGTRRGRSVVS
jgi:hypothetical protein